jgi:hypothetical protein
VIFFFTHSLRQSDLPLWSAERQEDGKEMRRELKQEERIRKTGCD